MKNELLVPTEEIVLDKPRHLRLDLNTFFLAERETGRNFLQNGLTDLDFTCLRAFLWAGLLHEDPDLTIDQVASMVHPGNLAEISAALLRLWSKSVTKSNAPLAESPRPGSSSGQPEGSV